MISPVRLPRGIRNNNPLNIDHNPANRWQGLADPPSDGRFCRFVSMELGVRAAAVLLRNYQRVHKLDTIAGIVTRWAPAVENNVNAYVNSVSRQTDIAPDAKLDLSDAETLVALIMAMARHECGMDIPETVVRQGVALAR